MIRFVLIVVPVLVAVWLLLGAAFAADWIMLGAAADAFTERDTDYERRQMELLSRHELQHRQMQPHPQLQFEMSQPSLQQKIDGLMNTPNPFLFNGR